MEKKQTHLMYGVICGASLIVMALVFHVTGLTYKPGWAYVSNIPFITIIILNAIAYSKANNGGVTFGNVFSSGFKASLVASLLMMVWAIICVYLFPEMKEKALEAGRESMAKNQNMTDEQIEMGLSITRKSWSAIMIFGSFVGTLFMGTIFSLIGGAAAKKNQVAPIGDNF